MALGVPAIRMSVEPVQRRASMSTLVFQEKSSYLSCRGQPGLPLGLHTSEPRTRRILFFLFL
jgi:hypothetical protein